MEQNVRTTLTFSALPGKFNLDNHVHIYVEAGREHVAVIKEPAPVAALKYMRILQLSIDTLYLFVFVKCFRGGKADLLSVRYVAGINY